MRMLKSIIDENFWEILESILGTILSIFDSGIALSLTQLFINQTAMQHC